MFFRRTREHPLDVVVLGNVGHNFKHFCHAYESQVFQILERTPYVRSIGYFASGTAWELDTFQAFFENTYVNTVIVAPSPYRRDVDVAEMHSMIGFIKATREARPHICFVLACTQESMRTLVSLYSRAEHYFCIDVESESVAQTRDTLRQCSNWGKRYYQYDVAISCCGEDIQRGRRLHKRLTRAGLKVFLYTEAVSEIAGKNLSKQLPFIYSARSRYCVPIISEAYLAKHWTQQELLQATHTHTLRGHDYMHCLVLGDVSLPEALANIVHHSENDQELATTLVDKCLAPKHGFKTKALTNLTDHDLRSLVRGW